MLHPDSRAKAHHILVKSAVTANTLMSQIHDFESFCEQAKQHSVCPSAKIAGDLGLTKPGVIVKPLEDAIFSVPLATLAGPIETIHGFHLLWVKKRHLPCES